MARQQISGMRNRSKITGRRIDMYMVLFQNGKMYQCEFGLKDDEDNHQGESK